MVPDIHTCTCGTVVAFGTDWLVWLANAGDVELQLNSAQAASKSAQKACFGPYGMARCNCRCDAGSTLISSFDFVLDWKILLYIASAQYI